MATTVVTPAKVSWFKKLGSFLGKVLKAVVQDGATMEKAAEPVLLTLFPQWTMMIQAGDAIATKILKGAAIVETNATAIGAAQTGPQKLQAVLDMVGSDVDAWAAAALPGSAQLSTAAKSGLVNAFVTIWNEIEPGDILTLPTSTAAPQAAPATK